MRGEGGKGGRGGMGGGEGGGKRSSGGDASGEERPWEGRSFVITVVERLLTWHFSQSQRVQTSAVEGVYM